MEGSASIIVPHGANPTIRAVEGDAVFGGAQHFAMNVAQTHALVGLPFEDADNFVVAVPCSQAKRGLAASVLQPSVRAEFFHQHSHDVGVAIPRRLVEGRVAIVIPLIHIHAELRHAGVQQSTWPFSASV